MHLEVISRNRTRENTPPLESQFRRIPAFDVRISALNEEIPRVLGKNATGEVRPEGFKTKEVCKIRDALLMKDFAWVSSSLTKEGRTTLRDTIFALYEYAKRIYSYCGVNLFFDSTKYGAVWAPSIDTFFVLDGLRAYARRLLGGGVRKAIEIGSGSGFIAKYILSTAKRLQELHAVDLDPDATRCSTDNLHALAQERKVYDVQARAEGLEYIMKSGTRFDLVVSNPPYIPRRTDDEKNPYAGTGLFTGLMENCHLFLSAGGILLLNISSLAEPECIAAVKEAKKRGMKVYEISEMRVPFKVMPVQNNAEWMRFLQSERNLQVSFRNGYDFWHNLNLFAVVND